MAAELEADDFLALVWLSIGVLAIISAAIYQFVVLKKTKKEAEKQSGMLVVNLPDT